MKVVIDYPPNMDDIDRAFHVKDKPNILYAYGDLIYNPSGVVIPNWLMVHETVHSVRQEDHGVERWWLEYIEDPKFRLNEEIFSHRSEYAQFIRENKDRNIQNKYFHFMAQRLAGPLYANLVTVQEAKNHILGIEQK